MPRLRKPLSAPAPLPEASIQAALEVLRGAQLFRYGEESAQAGHAAELEREFAAVTGRRYCVAMNSCGATLFAALRGLGVVPGTAVLFSSFTLAPVPGAIAHAGGVPIPVAVDRALHLDLEDLERRARQSGARILLVSYMRGHIGDLEALMACCDALGLAVVEDCAHTMGGHWRGRPTGAWGRVGCFSTQSFKHVDSGEGGLLVTDDEHVAATAIILSGSYALYDQHGACPESRTMAELQHTVPNCSMRMSNLAAAIVRPQIREIPQRVAQWNACYKAVHDGLAALGDPRLALFDRAPSEGFVGSSLQFRVAGIRPDEARAFVARLAEHGITLKWFGAQAPAGFTGRVEHWRFVSQTISSAHLDAVLGDLFDLRVPLWLERADIDLLCAAIGHALPPDHKTT